MKGKVVSNIDIKTNLLSGQALTQRILAIQNNTEDINDLLIEYKPFICSTASKVVGRSISEHSDESIIAQLAFAEAIKCFDEKKGRFLTFSRWVIRLRLIDYMRKESRDKHEILFSDLPDYMQGKVYDLNVIDHVVSPIKLEIQALAMDLKVYCIKFEDLVAVSPKAKKTKRSCAKIIKYMVSNEDALSYLRRKYRLPIKKIIENCKIPRKLVERHRKYIIVVTEILLGDYPHLEEYVSFVKGGHSYEKCSN